MAISSKDLESLWQRYKAEVVPAGIPINQFFESNGVPYHVFEKWYKKKFQAPNVVSVLLQVRQIQPVQFQHHPSSNMERKQYLDQIKELVQTVQTLLDANIALGNKQKEQKAESDRKIADLQEQVDKLTGDLQARRRKMHGKNNDRISSGDSLT